MIDELQHVVCNKSLVIDYLKHATCDKLLAMNFLWHDARGTLLESIFLAHYLIDGRFQRNFRLINFTQVNHNWDVL